MLRNAVDLAIEIAYQVEDNAQAIADFIYIHSLFGEIQAGSSRCDTDERAVSNATFFPTYTSNFISLLEAVL